MMNHNNNEAGNWSSSGKEIVIKENVNMHTNLGFSQNPLPSPQGQPALGTTSFDPRARADMPLHIKRATDLMITNSMRAEDNESKLVELAKSAMLELNMKVHAGEPLWKYDTSKKTEVLDEGEYVSDFLQFDASFKDMIRLIQKEHAESSLEGKFGEASGTYRTEATRCTRYINAKASYVAEMLMDHHQWSAIFCGIISSPVHLGAIPVASPGKNDEALHLVRAGFQMANPQVNVRECPFLRYKKQISPEVWGVVELSVEKVFPYKRTTEFRRRASGCLIFEMPNEHSKIVWVEHIETHDSDVQNHYNPFVFSGLAFGAHRYVDGLVRYCHLRSTISLLKTPIMLDEQSEISQFGKGKLLRLSQRMVRIFLHNISLAYENKWVPMPASNDENTMKMRMDKIITANGNHHTVISFSTSVFIPVRPHVVFEFLKDPKSRPKWDADSFLHEIKEHTRIVLGGVPENCISIIETKSTILKKSGIYLQESFTDGTGLYVIYAPINEQAMDMVLKGRNPDRVRMLPSGFVIHPDRAICIDRDVWPCFSVVTIALNIVEESSTEHHVQPKSVDVARKILEETCRKIHAGVFPPQIEDEDHEEDSDDEDSDDEDSDDEYDEDDSNDE